MDALLGRKRWVVFGLRIVPVVIRERLVAFMGIGNHDYVLR